jgi:tryptophan synthase beta chain
MNAIGLFHEFLPESSVAMVGVEAGGRGSELGEHAARLARIAPRRNGARPGVLHGTYTYVLQDRHGQVSTTHSVSAGLDYPAVGPEHAFLGETGRVEYTAASDDEAVEAARVLAQQEGIIPALEPAHALAELIKRAPAIGKNNIVVVNLSGRGDKDMDILSKHLS